MSFDHFFELNKLKAQSQDKDTVISKLKERIKSLSGNKNTDKVKKDIEEIETINIELDHRVSKLIAENKHLKQTYKQLYDSIKPTRVRSKEQSDALINQVNQKSVEISDVNVSLQEKDLVITALKDDLRKLKGKDLVDDLEQAVILREVVKQGKSQNPLNNSLDHALKPSTSASGSQPSGNTKKDKIQRPPHSTQKNKVEAHPRTAKSSLKNKNCTVEPKGTASVQHSKLNAISELICVKCNGCILSDNHDLCVLNDVNAHSGCSNHMTRDRSQLTNFVYKFLGTVKFGNDHVAKILGYGNYQIGNVMISRVYYVEGLGHNLFSVGQFCDSNLEVAFHQHTCFIRNLDGVDILTGSRGNNLYTLPLGDMMASSPICLLSKASKTKSWLWHRRLSHLNFGAINHLARQGLVRGLPKLKFEKDHLCFACAMCKSKKKPYKPKSKDINQEKLYLLYMDLCGPMLVASVNGNKTDNGTEFVNQTLCEYYEKVEISHETSVARFSQQNGVVERRNRMLIKVARTMLIYAKALLFLWAEVVATACYTQNRSIVRLRHGKTPRVIETIHVDFDELTAMASEHSSSVPALYEMTPATISLGLVPYTPPSTPFVPPLRTDWDILFQPL
nr:hypothetical protein [Tanacetum cinerariifolium]